MVQESRMKIVLLLHLTLNKSSRDAYKHVFILPMLLTEEMDFGDLMSPLQNL